MLRFALLRFPLPRRPYFNRVVVDGDVEFFLLVASEVQLGFVSVVVLDDVEAEMSSVKIQQIGKLLTLV